MIGWLHAALIAVSAAFLALVLFLIIRRWARPRSNDAAAERGQNLQSGIARLHQVSPHHHHLDAKASYQLFRRGAPPKPAFSWADHPSLVTDAVEHGWPRFAFTAVAVQSSPSVRSARSLLGACATGDHGGDRGVEVGWEVCEGSADFMQKIRLNPDVKSAGSSSIAAAAVIRTALPLPGPNLGNSSFPQEAYFEVTVVACSENSNQANRERRGRSEGDDKIKLIDEDFNAKNSPDSLNHGASSHSQRRSKVEEGIIAKNEAVLLCVGLTGLNPLPFRIPGTFPASIGFNSTGSLSLDGTKLVPESEADNWGRTDKVVGCGYNPGQRKVFFTVDSQVVHEIQCKTEDYCTPLYPTLAANGDVVLLVNLGQSPFRFAPANMQRTPNPCFIGPMGTSPALGFEDSKELFSMGRIDSLWMQRSAARSNNNTVNSIKAMEEYDQESEGDLFEIVLESSGRSPYTTLNIH
ncbi:uncharacterized protein LOC131010799 [Salvia miltiorrhiza]|uniref:uncharacterized protein LOC131010799 n=1 Tax=Salvia miltiorrhiza TaxID=226208 RepID=UPI0025ABFA33|nr:uncharacterized protein LOC131010799 [Salvia miltiorrhiza]